jgi:hypothetical protein
MDKVLEEVGALSGPRRRVLQASMKLRRHVRNDRLQDTEIDCRCVEISCSSFVHSFLELTLGEVEGRIGLRDQELLWRRLFFLCSERIVTRRRGHRGHQLLVWCVHCLQKGTAEFRKFIQSLSGAIVDLEVDRVEQTEGVVDARDGHPPSRIV